MRKLSMMIGCVLALVGCSSSDVDRKNVGAGDPFADYEDMNVNVIGAEDGDGSSTNAPDGEPDGEPADGDAVVGTTPVLVGSSPGTNWGETEVCVSDTLCEVPPLDDSNFCEREGGPVDLIYVDGELVDTVCYPPAEDPERPVEEVTTATGDVDVVQSANKTTVVFGEETDGIPLEGDVSVDGNNVAIYGNGPDNTIIDGNVTLDGNNARLRGLTITGDLILRKNRVAVVLTRILGNVRLETMSTNGSIFAENDVFGSFTSTSNGNLIVGNRVAGEFTHEGNGNICDRNAAFADDDGDQLVDEAEHGELLSCD